MKAFFNDEMLNANEISISPDDLIVQRGFGVFDFFRIVSGKPLFIKDHLDRFFKSADLAKIPLRWNRDDLCKKIYRLLEINQQESGGIKLILSGGISPMGFEVISPNLMIIQNFAKSPNPSQYEKGCKLITSEFMRELPQVKTTNYFNSVWLHAEMKKYDAIDVLYHQKGLIHELSRSNIFLVRDGTLSTPKSNILKGITRDKVIMLAEKLMPVRIRDITILELEEAEEVFISSSLKKVMPITEIDGKLIANGKPGAITKKIVEAFEEYVFASLR